MFKIQIFWRKPVWSNSTSQFQHCVYNFYMISPCLHAEGGIGTTLYRLPLELIYLVRLKNWNWWKAGSHSLRPYDLTLYVEHFFWFDYFRYFIFMALWIVCFAETGLFHLTASFPGIMLWILRTQLGDGCWPFTYWSFCCWERER